MESFRANPLSMGSGFLGDSTEDRVYHLGEGAGWAQDTGEYRWCGVESAGSFSRREEGIERRRMQ